MDDLCDFGCGSQGTHWCYEWDGYLCDLCCTLQNVRDCKQVISCDYLWATSQLLLTATVEATGN